MSELDVLDFLNTIDQWIADNKLDLSRVNHEKCDYILNIDHEELKNMDSTDLLTFSYILSGYGDYINKESNKLKGVVDYANDSIAYIVAPNIDNYGDNYVKYEKKYNLAIRENPLAAKLYELKKTAALRLQMLENKALNIKRMSDILFELSRKKQWSNHEFKN